MSQAIATPSIRAYAKSKHFFFVREKEFLGFTNLLSYSLDTYLFHLMGFQNLLSPFSSFSGQAAIRLTKGVANSMELCRLVCLSCFSRVIGH